MEPFARTNGMNGTPVWGPNPSPLRTSPAPGVLAHICTAAGESTSRLHTRQQAEASLLQKERASEMRECTAETTAATGTMSPTV